MTITLNTITDQELETFFNLTKDEEFFLRLRAGIYSLENLKAYLESKKSLNSRVFGIFNEISIVGLLLEIPKEEYLEMGLWISAKFSGLNYGTQSTAAYINLHPPGVKIRCLVETTNFASKKMLTNNGFTEFKETPYVTHFQKIT